MTVVATPNGAASDDIFLRASFDRTTGGAFSSRTGSSHSHKSGLASKDNHWRPTSAKSAHSAGRARRRSPSPLLSPFARVSRHKDEIGNMRASTSNGRRPSHSRRGSLSSGGAPPPLTCEEFEALPVAIQRKYFSTLERLRFAQGSSNVDGIYQHYDAISAQNLQRRRPRQDRIASDNITTRLRKRSLRLESSALLLPSSSSHEPSPATSDALADRLFYANLPDKIKKREFTREEQVALAGQLRASVILDAADEAIYKIGRRSSITHRLIAPDITVDTPTTTSFRHSMETIYSSSDPRLGLGRRDALGLEQQQQQASTSLSKAAKRISGVPESFYDSFRWLEEDDSLDLRLFMDDYHANLRETLPSPSKERRPSFRRHLSISKMPFSRPLPISSTAGSLPGASGNNTISSSIGSSRPATKDDVSSMRTATSPSINGNGGGIGGGNGVIPFPTMSTSSSSNFSSPTKGGGGGGHMRRKSRTLSLITPKQHAAHDSISTIDPGAAHYQDPEARMKLRVYLASPQKFDEAIEFGFPSTEVLSAHALGGPAGSPPIGSSTILSSTSTKGNRISTATTAVEKRYLQHRGTRQTSTPDLSGTMRTFLADADNDDENGGNGKSDDDEMTKLDSDQASIPDSESPRTPNLADVVISSNSNSGGRRRKTSSSSGAFRPYRMSSTNGATKSPQLLSGHRPSDSYAHAPASSREMTLRMTLTRLDLRAAEDQIYGWQQQTQQQAQQHHVYSHSTSHSHRQSRHQQHHQSVSYSGGRKQSISTAGVARPFIPPPRNDSLVLPSGVTTTTTTTTTTTSTCDSTITYLGAGTVSRPKESIEDVFAGIDHWEADQDKGVMKRFWNRVRRA
ncbi:hypothetical protein SCUCBS95973_008553 [Sporothrix curviconia]|uniref:Mucin n=1 Tax=Sporothrix curviconia TaxID=1260050 RepID=A0ABP0CQL7_9PEZI